MHVMTTALLASLAVLAAGPPSARMPAAARATASDQQADVPVCVRWRTEARYRNYGYDHVVTLHNGCEAPAVCTVTTNVNPDPISAQVAPGMTTDVLTFRGSPAREFEARVRCALEARAGR